MKVSIYPGLIRGGTVKQSCGLWPVARLLTPRNVKFIPYTKQTPGTIFLGSNNAPGIRHERQLIRIGGLGKPLPNFDLVYHMVFNSTWINDIFNTRVKNDIPSSIIHHVGGLPGDSDLTPVTTPRKIEGPICFLAAGKWWKRKYKRLSQIVSFFNKYVLKKYPGSYLHVVAVKQPRREGNVIYHQKSFSDTKLIEVFRNSHIHISLSRNDGGPTTVSESMHYRVPFICTTNCGYKDLLEHVDGKCGRVIEIDPLLKTYRQYIRSNPKSRPAKAAKGKLTFNPAIVMEAIDDIVSNYEEYTSWRWKDGHSYDDVADKWMSILKL